MQATLILLRHGQSFFNQKNIFTGWVDVPLSAEGIIEAKEAGAILKKEPIDVIYTSTLIRAQMTAAIVMSVHSSKKTPVFLHPEDTKESAWGKIYDEKLLEDTIAVRRDFRLNERMYGDLQGYNKSDMKKRFGEEKVREWRRSYRTPPPNGESLEDTTKRTIPYFVSEVLPLLQQGKHVLIAAHGNSLRAVVKFVEALSEEEVLQLEIPTGKPLIYTYDGVFKKRGAS